jgi:hypothetical protein
MPLCSYFLEGFCSSAECPFLHINFGADVPICKAYERGYCPEGQNCSHRHVRRQGPGKQKQKRKWEAGGGNDEGGLGGGRQEERERDTQVVLDGEEVAEGDGGLKGTGILHLNAGMSLARKGKRMRCLDLA